MNFRVLCLFATLTFSSCGLLGIAINDDPVNTDPEFRERVLSQYENTPLAKHQDSLLAKIDAATVAVPTDIYGTILMIETLDYEDYAKSISIKYHRPDSAKLKKYFQGYSKGIAKEKFLKNPRYRTIYAKKKTYEAFDPAAYRYVLRQTIRIDNNRDELVVTQAGFVYPFVATAIYYLYDRQTGSVFREIKDLKVLEK